MILPNTTDLEVWKSIPGFPGYDASNMGRIRSWKPERNYAKAPEEPRILKGNLSNYGYLMVKLTNAEGKKSGQLVHSLVLLTFQGPCPAGMECRHLHGVKTDNRWPESIAWGTPKENGQDKVRHGTAASGQRNGMHTKPWSRLHGERQPNSKLRDADIPEIRRMIERGIPNGVIGSAFGVSHRVISGIKCGTSWRHAQASTP